MKHILLLATLLFSMGAWAQTYPFAEGFHGQPSGQVPSGWSGDIPVLSYHGLNEEKSLAAEIGGADLVDSIISPLIGPLTNVSTVSFWYRIIDKNIYPSTPTTLGAGDKVEVFISNDGTNLVFSWRNASAETGQVTLKANAGEPWPLLLR